MKKLLLLLIIPFLCFGQTPITQENIFNAAEEWVADPVLAEKTYGHISDWDVSNVTSMNGLFYGASSFNQDIGDWDVSNVTDMETMFSGAESFNQDIGDWDVSSVTEIDAMFYDAASFNQDIGDWDVSNVVWAYSLFTKAESFNQDIGDWDVGNIKQMGYMFYEATSFNQDIGDWDVSNVIYMDNMFGGDFLSSPFNQDIGNWDVSSVTDMNCMFQGAASFNQDIGDWDVSSVTDMENMFYNSSQFNQDIGNWDVSNVIYMGQMLEGVALSIQNYDALLCGWSQLNLVNDVVFTAGFSSTYCNGGASRQYIIDTFDWTIEDGGLSDDNCGYNCDELNCSLLSVADIVIDDINMTIDIAIYDGNVTGAPYPYIAYTIDSSGDTIQTGNINSFGNLGLDTSWYEYALNSLPNYPLAVYYVYGMDSDTCVLTYNSTPTSIEEPSVKKKLISIVDILGRETANNKGFQLHIYHDGSVEKKYVIK
tara:strand:- start:852 stop:2291 length:1440 start_codon:yes stop_codon:yes gene_type:complete